MKPRTFAAAALLVALLPAASASARAAGAARTSSHDQAVHELFRVMGLQQTAVLGATTMIDAQVQANPAIEPYRDVMIDWATKYLTWDAMLPGMTAIYKDTFSEPEVREMIAFYRTPTGKKVLETMPDVMQRSAEVGIALAQENQGELEKMVAKRRRELEKASK
jgi:uncharacterized protein